MAMVIMFGLVSSAALNMIVVPILSIRQTRLYEGGSWLDDPM